MRGKTGKVLVSAAALSAQAAMAGGAEGELLETLRPYVAGVAGEFGRISEERKAVLDEVAACNIRTVRALRRAGLSVADSTGGENPVCLVQYAEGAPAIRAFSKVYDAEGNPKEGFAAMMCCDHADEACPLVRGASGRFSVLYVDPKNGDGTPGEAAGYDERCRQIAGEMFYLMSRVRR